MKLKRFITAERVKLAISLFLRLTIIAAIVAAIINQRWTVLFVSIMAFASTFLPAIIERNYKIHLPSEFEFVITIFLYSSLFLGEVRDYYARYWWWDIFLHGIAGIALGFVGFLIVYVLYYENKIKTSPMFVAIFSFSFAVALGAVWEIFEFAMDSFFGLNMQKSGLVDTMWDLIVDSGGALITCLIGLMYIKGGKTRLFGRLVNKFFCENPQFGKKADCK